MHVSSEGREGVHVSSEGREGGYTLVLQGGRGYTLVLRGGRGYTLGGGVHVNSAGGGYTTKPNIVNTTNVRAGVGTYFAIRSPVPAVVYDEGSATALYC